MLEEEQQVMEENKQRKRRQNEKCRDSMKRSKEGGVRCRSKTEANLSFTITITMFLLDC